MTFEYAYKDISRINKKDSASHTERLGKFFEEAGELAKAVNKTNGRKVLSSEDTPEKIKDDILDEAADSTQNIISILDGFGFTAQDLIDRIHVKNIKWEKKINSQNRTNPYPIFIRPIVQMVKMVIKKFNSL